MGNSRQLALISTSLSRKLAMELLAKYTWQFTNLLANLLLLK